MTNQEININIINNSNADVPFDIFGENIQTSQNSVSADISGFGGFVYSPILDLYFYTNNATNTIVSINSSLVNQGISAIMASDMRFGVYNNVNNAVYFGGNNFVAKIVGNFAAVTIIPIVGGGFVNNMVVHPSGDI